MNIHTPEHMPGGGRGKEKNGEGVCVWGGAGDSIGDAASMRLEMPTW